MSMLKRKARQVMSSVWSGTDRWVSWLKGTAFKVTALLLLGTMQVWVSLFLYGSLYYTYMPTVAHISPVYLQFGSCREYGIQANCPFPSVNTTLVKNRETGRLLMRGQKYRVLLELDMPQSPVNEHLGVFMVKLEIYAAGGEVTGSSFRPAMMHYRSTILKTIETLLFSPFLVMGYSEEKQILPVSLMENYVDNPYKPMIGAHVELQVRQLEIYSSVLKIQAYFTGLRYIMFNWPISTALFFSSVFFLFLSLITVLSWQQCSRAFSSQQSESDVVRMEDVYSVAYEERRKMLRKTMESERASLFKGYPKNVSVINQVVDEGILDDRASQSSGISSVDAADTGYRGSSLMNTNQAEAVPEGSSDSNSWEVLRVEKAGCSNKEQLAAGAAAVVATAVDPWEEVEEAAEVGKENKKEFEKDIEDEKEVEGEVGEEIAEEICEAGEQVENEDVESNDAATEETEVTPFVLEGEELRKRHKRDPDNNNL